MAQLHACTRGSAVPSPRSPSVHLAPNMSHPVAPGVTPPRQLAPTVGPSAALAGVCIWTGYVLPSGERVVCGLAQQFGSLCFVEDNASCLGGEPLPSSGTVDSFGSHLVFVATVRPRFFLECARTAKDPPCLGAPRGSRDASLGSVAEVLVVIPAADAPGPSGTAPEGPPPAPKKSSRSRWPPLERVGESSNAGGTSDPPRPSKIDKAIENLQAYVPGADVRLDAEQVEAQRLAVLEEAKRVAVQH